MLQQSIGKAIADKRQEAESKLAEHTAKIKAKIESGNAIDKSIIDREAIKELNQKEAHSKAKVAKQIKHTITQDFDRLKGLEFTTIIIDRTLPICKGTYEQIAPLMKGKVHLYIMCPHDEVVMLHEHWLDTAEVYTYIHTFKYSSKLYKPKIGYKEHYEYVLYINNGNKPVNHLLPNVIESTYAKDSRNLGFYTNLLLRSANAGDTILGINITNGNLIKAAQAMLCSTVIIPADSIAGKECEKTIEELQFK